MVGLEPQLVMPGRGDTVPQRSWKESGAEWFVYLTCLGPQQVVTESHKEQRSELDKSSTHSY